MATSSAQRVGILIIAIVMVIGTLGSFAVMVLANKNATIDQQRIDQITAEYQKEYNVYQAKVDVQAEELSDKYYSDFKRYLDRVGVFDASQVAELKNEDLKIGDGEEIRSNSSYSAYYVGWAPDGKIFDQSIDGDKLKAPLPGGNMIQGWNEGVIGMKVGGVRELTIPSAKAYGEAGTQGIEPNTPLKFIVMIISQPEVIPQPEVPQELLNQYTQ